MERSLNRERKERRDQQALERVTSNILANMMNEERITPKGIQTDRAVIRVEKIKQTRSLILNVV